MRAVFVMVGAFLGRIDSATRCGFWADDPTEHDFDAQQLITIDLARNPSAAIAGDIPWDAVEVDDSFNGPNGQVLGTTLGASWPELQLAGLVCLHQQFWRRLPDAIRPTCPPRGANCHDYEFMSVVYCRTPPTLAPASATLATTRRSSRSAAASRASPSTRRARRSARTRGPRSCGSISRRRSSAMRAPRA